MNVCPHRYAARVRWTGASGPPTTSYPDYDRGYVVEIDGKPALRGSADPHFRGDPSLHNPEDLLVAALSACHLLSYLALCARAGIAVVSYEDDARGEMTSIDGAIRFREVTLHPHVVVADAARADEALALHERAHAECFIANSVNFPVRHEAVVHGPRHAEPTPRHAEPTPRHAELVEARVADDDGAGALRQAQRDGVRDGVRDGT
jgi:organic hydroperoxide reductase OsmC/OhrA